MWRIILVLAVALMICTLALFKKDQAGQCGPVAHFLVNAGLVAFALVSIVVSIMFTTVAVEAATGISHILSNGLKWIWNH